MPVEITPPPPEEIRETLAAVLERELDGPEPVRAWWRAGLDESVDEDLDGVAVQIV